MVRQSLVYSHTCFFMFLLHCTFNQQEHRGGNILPSVGLQTNCLPCLCQATELQRDKNTAQMLLEKREKRREREGGKTKTTKKLRTQALRTQKTFFFLPAVKYNLQI